MKRLLILFLSHILCVFVQAQSQNFLQVFEACVYVQRAMDKGQGSNNEIKYAGELLSSAEWNYLKLINDKVDGEAEFEKETMVFTPEYLVQFSENKKLVHYKAKQYADEKAAVQRGNSKVKLCTKCIGGKQSVTYKIRQSGNTLDVAAVAEVNGLINLSVVVKDEKGHVSEPYKVNSDEFKGAKSRKIHLESLPKGNNTVYITIENKYKKTRSVAIILE